MGLGSGSVWIPAGTLRSDRLGKLCSQQSCLCCLLLSSRVSKAVGTYSFLFLRLLITLFNVFGTGAIRRSSVLLQTAPGLTGGKTRAALLPAAAQLLCGQGTPKSGRFIALPRRLLWTWHRSSAGPVSAFKQAETALGESPKEMALTLRFGVGRRVVAVGGTLGHTVLTHTRVTPNQRGRYGLFSPLN